MSELTRLIVTRDEQDDQKNHVVLAIKPVVSEDLLLNHHFTVDEMAEVEISALWVAGRLARMGFEILADVQLSGKNHGCQWQPFISIYRTDPDPEIRQGAFADDACSILLSPGADEPAFNGLMPTLWVTVPKNRERAWTKRLQDVVQALATAEQG